MVLTLDPGIFSILPSVHLNFSSSGRVGWLPASGQWDNKHSGKENHSEESKQLNTYQYWVWLVRQFYYQQNCWIQSSSSLQLNSVHRGYVIKLLSISHSYYYVVITSNLFLSCPPVTQRFRVLDSKYAMFARNRILFSMWMASDSGWFSYMWNRKQTQFMIYLYARNGMNP